MPGHVSCAVEGAIAVVTFDNSARLNAIDQAIASGLAETAAALAGREDINAVLLRGAGLKAFSAGVDLKAAQASGDVDGAFAGIDTAMKELERNLASMSVPCVAMLSGVVYGGGVQISSMADFRIASSDLRLAIPAIPNRLFYPIHSLERLAALIGWPNTRRLIYDAGPHDAATLHRWGFIDEVVAPAEIESAALAYARRLAEKPREIMTDYRLILEAAEKGDRARAEQLRAQAKMRELERKQRRS